MKHNEGGKEAEEHVTEYLQSMGYKIVDRNWKTRQCEIDIVACKKKCMYFVEVKYRMSSEQGTGFEYITKAKLQQMAFAARYWVAVNKWEGEYTLSGASVFGDSFAIDFIEEL